ncbi:MAG: hypothetical protein QNJ13_10070 [Paracoccaceae bacterium]|nr:hypothetical protein [Paracoccaceae bacterium]
MQTIQAGYRSLTLLVDLNWDRILYIATLIFALMAGGYIGTLLTALRGLPGGAPGF